MVFSSLLFLYIFLPVSVGVYYCVKGVKAKNVVLTIASLAFYAWGQPLWALLMLLTGVADYVLGRMIDQNWGEWKAKLAFALSLGVNLGALCIFRYVDMLVDALNVLPGVSITPARYAVPVGMIVYTLSSLTYIIDLRRGRIHAQPSFLNYMTFVTMFPRLMAGPVSQYAELEPSLGKRECNVNKLASGVTRFIIGLGKVALLGKPLSDVSAALLEGNLAAVSMLGGWLGVILFGLRLCLTLSGYSDMAIGMGRMFGFEYGENFRYPFTSISVTEFFSRFYASLNAFCYDYVYGPMGGDKSNGARNLLTVGLCTGLFFGASWNMALWGLYIGGLFLLERYVLGERLLKWPSALRVAFTLFAVTLGWALFYFTDLGRMGHMLAIMLGVSGQAFSAAGSRAILGRSWFLILLSVAACLPYIADYVRDRLNRLAYAGSGNWVIGMNVAFNLVVLIMSTSMLVLGTYNPFVYLQG